MKKLLLPLSVAVAGLILLAISLFQPSAGNGDVEVEIVKTDFIMPAAHNVYANPNALDGKYYLFKAKVTNKTGAQLEDVVINYDIPGFIEKTELAKVKKMLPGQTVVVACYPKFDKSITEKTTESMERARIEISWDGLDDDDAIEEEFAFKITGRNEYVYTGIPASEVSSWADMYDNDKLLACYVTPSDPVIKYYTQIVQEKILKGEQATVSNKPEDGLRFLMGIYEATRMAHMVYSGTKGVPQSTEDVQSIVQTVRLPREVVTGNTGLCIELSCLYASMLSAAGVDPIIYLVPGHAYPGFRMNGQYYAIEATMINGEGLGGIGTAQQAFEKGQKQLQEFMQYAQMGDPRYSIVDVHALNQQGVISMALEDDDFLKSKVDKIAENFTPAVSQQQDAQQANYQQQNTRNPDNGGGGGNSGFVGRTQGPLSFGIPSGWQKSDHPFPQVPIWTTIVIAPNQRANASIFDVPANSVDEALQVMQQYFSSFGSEMQYQRQGNTIQGTTYSSNGTFMWQGKALQTQNGIRIAAVGADESVYNQMSGTLKAIFNSIN